MREVKKGYILRHRVLTVSLDAMQYGRSSCAGSHSQTIMVLSAAPVTRTADCSVESAHSRLLLILQHSSCPAEGQDQRRT